MSVHTNTTLFLHVTRCGHLDPCGLEKLGSCYEPDSLDSIYILTLSVNNQTLQVELQSAAILSVPALIRPRDRHVSTIANENGGKS